MNNLIVFNYSLASTWYINVPQFHHLTDAITVKSIQQCSYISVPSSLTMKTISILCLLVLLSSALAIVKYVPTHTVQRSFQLLFHVFLFFFFHTHRVKLQRHNVYRDSVTMRAMLHAKYTPGMRVPAAPLLGDSPEPLTDYLDVSKKVEDVFQLLDQLLIEVIT